MRGGSRHSHFFLRRRLHICHGVFILLLYINRLETLDFLTLTLSLRLKGLRFDFPVLRVLHILSPFHVLLTLELLEELFVTDKDAVGVSLFLSGPWEQFRCRVPTDGLLRIDT